MSDQPMSPEPMQQPEPPLAPEPIPTPPSQPMPEPMPEPTPSPTPRGPDLVAAIANMLAALDGLLAISDHAAVVLPALAGTGVRSAGIAAALAQARAAMSQPGDAD